MKKLKTLSLLTLLMGVFLSVSHAIPTFKGTLGGFNYYETTSATSWTLAEAEAVSFGGHLASIHSEAENAFIRGLFPSARIWIGLNDAATEGTFVWSDGSAVGFTKWNGGEPNNLGGEDYTEMRSDAPGTWNDLPNHILLKGVIKKSVPDAGSSLGLLGISLLGLFLARKRARK